MATHASDDIASQLLHSSDARIAEAAKRVFSSTYPVVSSMTHPSAPTSSFQSFDGANSSLHQSAPEMSGQVCGVPSAVGVPAHGRAEHTAINSPPPLASGASNDDLHDDLEDGDTKPSSTERLQRR